jgi:hypothetical protein
MPTYRMKTLKEPEDILKKRREANRTDVAQVEPVHPAGFQRTTDDVNSLSPTNVLQLQRTVGNRAVGQLLDARTAEQAAETGQQVIQRSAEQEEEEDLMEALCPGSKIRSGGQGRGEGTGEGKGPIGYPKDEEW